MVSKSPLLEGDAVDVLSTLTETYDFVFMDSAKSKYIVFCLEILKHLEVGGVVVLDDIFQGGDVAKDIMRKSAEVNAPFTVVCKDFSMQLLNNPGSNSNSSSTLRWYSHATKES